MAKADAADYPSGSNVKLINYFIYLPELKHNKYNILV